MDKSSSKHKVSLLNFHKITQKLMLRSAPVKKIFLGLVVVCLVLGIGVVALVVGDALMGSQATDVTNVTFTAADGTILHGYLAQPADAGVYPAVLMVHEWWGLNAEIVEMADTLAEEGYVVLAPDTYRGSAASTVPGALYLRLNVPEERVDSDMQAAFSYLAALENVDAARIGVMGFCYGGGVALRHAVLNPAIAATINLYGDTIADATGFGALRESGRPILGIFGEDDNQIPVAEVEAFETALTGADIPHEVTIYPGVGHAFVNPEAIAEAGAAQEAWAQILAFLDANLRNVTAA
jgi:carboxymethylenebutenolidase